MTSVEELLQYICVILSRSKHKTRRVDTPEGYCVILEVSELRLLFTREDISALLLNEERDWLFPAPLPDELLGVLEHGSEKIEEGGKNE